MPEIADLRDWLALVAEMGELAVITDADLDLEIGCASALNAQIKDSYALMFDKIKGYPAGYRVLTSALTKRSRVALSFGFPATYSDAELADAVCAKLQEWHSTWPQFSPETAKTGSVLENVHSGNEINLSEFPAPKWYEGDGGRYIGTGDAVITRDADTGEVNFGTYRTMVVDRRSATFYPMPGKHGRFQYEKYHARGEKCPVAISLGHDPLIFMVACINFPPGSEYNFAGAIRKKPVRVIIEEVTGLPVPADSEVVIAGWSRPDGKKPEGPFGEWTGYYAQHEQTAPAIQIERVYHRHNPVILGMPNHRGKSDGSYYTALMGGCVLQSEAVRSGLPGIKRIWLHQGTLQMFIVAAIKQLYAGHDKDVAMFIHSKRTHTPLARYVIVVDDDIDPSNIDEVIWAMCTRCDPEKHIDIIRRTRTGAIDPTIPLNVPGTRLLSSRATISACKPYERLDEYPQEIRIGDELKRRVVQKWGDQLGIK